MVSEISTAKCVDSIPTPVHYGYIELSGKVTAFAIHLIVVQLKPLADGVRSLTEEAYLCAALSP